jgi:hypothetical protein
LTQNKASRGYKHNEHTPDLCIDKMHTTTLTHAKKSWQNSKVI